MMTKRVTKEEVRTIQTLLMTHTYEEVAEIMERSLASIKGIVYRSNLDAVRHRQVIEDGRVTKRARVHSPLLNGTIAQYIMHNPDATVSEVAKAEGVPESTVLLVMRIINEAGIDIKEG